MIVRLITIHVKPGYYDEFEAATADNHRASIEEPGVIRFDVMRDDQNPGVYMLYEMYRSDEAVLLHKETSHYQRWRDAVEPMMATPREGRDLTLLYPASE